MGVCFYHKRPVYAFALLFLSTNILNSKVSAENQRVSYAHCNAALIPSSSRLQCEGFAPQGLWGSSEASFSQSVRPAIASSFVVSSLLVGPSQRLPLMFRLFPNSTKFWQRFALPLSSLAVLGGYLGSRLSAQTYFASIDPELGPEGAENSSELPMHSPQGSEPPDPDDDSRPLAWMPAQEYLEPELRGKYHSFVQELESEPYDFMDRYVQTLIEVKDLDQQKTLKRLLDHEIHKRSTNKLHPELYKYVSDHLKLYAAKLSLLRAELFGFADRLKIATQGLEATEAEEVMQSFYRVFHSMVKTDKELVKKFGHALRDKSMSLYTNFHDFGGLLFALRSAFLRFGKELSFNHPLVHGAMSKSIVDLSGNIANLSDNLLGLPDDIKYSILKSTGHHVKSRNSFLKIMLQDKAYHVNISYDERSFLQDPSHVYSKTLDNSLSAMYKYLVVMGDNFQAYDVPYAVKNDVILRYKDVDRRLLLSVAYMYKLIPLMHEFYWFELMRHHRKKGVGLKGYLYKKMNFLYSRPHVSIEEYLQKTIDDPSIAKSPLLVYMLELSTMATRVMQYFHEEIGFHIEDIEKIHIKELIAIANMKMSAEIASDIEDRTIWNLSTKIFHLNFLLVYHGLWAVHTKRDQKTGESAIKGFEHPIFEYYFRDKIESDLQNFGTEGMEELNLQMYLSDYKDHFQSLDPMYIRALVKSYPLLLDLKNVFISLQTITLNNAFE